MRADVAFARAARGGSGRTSKSSNLSAIKASHIVPFLATDIEPVGTAATRALETHDLHWVKPATSQRMAAPDIPATELAVLAALSCWTKVQYSFPLWGGIPQVPTKSL